MGMFYMKGGKLDHPKTESLCVFRDYKVPLVNCVCFWNIPKKGLVSGVFFSIY